MHAVAKSLVLVSSLALGAAAFGAGSAQAAQLGVGANGNSNVGVTAPGVGVGVGAGVGANGSASGGSMNSGVRSQGSIATAPDNDRDSGSVDTHAKSNVHSNAGGAVRGLNRADESAGAHGDIGRDRAEQKQMKH